MKDFFYLEDEFRIGMNTVASCVIGHFANERGRVPVTGSAKK
jgi:hypothetical protein